MSERMPLDPAMVRDLVGPGTTPAVLTALSQAQVGKRLLQLTYVARTVRREAPELAGGCGFLAAYELLKDCPAGRVAKVAAYPSFGRWCAVANRFVDLGSHLDLPDGQVTSHLALLGTFAIAAAAPSRAAALDLPLDDEGKLCLPEWGLSVDAGLERAGDSARCELATGGLVDLRLPGGMQISVELGRAPARHASNASSAVRLLPRLATRWELNDADPLLRTGFEARDFERVGEDAACRWQAGINQALALLRQVMPDTAAEVEQGIDVLVPLVSRSPSVHRSAASAETYGMAQMSWSDEPWQLAEAIVHEHCHNKLNALLDLDPVLVGDADTPRFYSPWRDDPRPLFGLLHAAFSFYAVTTFWRACVGAGNAPGAAARAPREFTRRREQVRPCLDDLTAHSELTTTGAVLLGEIRRRLDALPDVELTADVRRSIIRDTAEHRRHWLSRVERNDQDLGDRIEKLMRTWPAFDDRCQQSPSTAVPVPRFSAPRKHSARFIPSDPVCQDMCRALGVPAGVAVNRLADRAVRRDTTLDALGRLSIVDPEAYAELVERLHDVSGSDTLTLLLSAHVYYVNGAYAQAADLYARCLDVAPDDIDLWRDFAFALRHLGFHTESDTVLFDLDLVVSAAAALLPVGHTPECLWGAALETDGAIAGGPAHAYLLALRWIRGQTR